MSFFKDFKEDLSQAVNELMPEDEAVKEAVAAVPDEADESPTQSDDYSQLFASFDDPETASESPAAGESGEEEYEEVIEEVVEEVDGDYDGDEEVIEEVIYVDEDGNPIEDIPDDAEIEEIEEVEEVEEVVGEEVEEIVEDDDTDYFAEEPVEEPAAEPVEQAADDTVSYGEMMSTLSASEPEGEDTSLYDDGPINTVTTPIFEETPREAPINTIWDDKATASAGCIIEGMTVNGNINCAGSLEVLGIVAGNLDVSGKLSIAGKVEGDSKADNIFVDGAKITGGLYSNNSVKIAQGSVVKGNIKAAAAVLAGAVKGDIDVQGPVVLDATAVIVGNIKSKSIQINNGAIIEGSCSQCYSDVTASNFFEDED